MNKYQRFSKAKLSKNLRDPLDVFDEVHKDTLDQRASRVGDVFRVSRQIHELLLASDLSEQGRSAAMQIVGVLLNRLSDK